MSAAIAVAVRCGYVRVCRMHVLYVHAYGHAGWCVHTRVPRRRCRRRASRNSDHVAAAPLSRRRRAQRPRQRVSVCGVGVAVCVVCFVVLVHVLPASQPASQHKLAEAELLRCSFSFSISVSDSASPRNHHHRASRARKPHTHTQHTRDDPRSDLSYTDIFFGGTQTGTYTIYTYMNILCTLTKIRTDRALLGVCVCILAAFSVSSPFAWFTKFSAIPFGSRSKLQHHVFVGPNTTQPYRSPFCCEIVLLRACICMHSSCVCVCKCVWLSPSKE